MASTVAEGMARLEPLPDFLVLDLTLPDGVGETVLWKVRRDRLYCRVVMCTGIEDPQRLSALRALAPDAVRTKSALAPHPWKDPPL